MNRTTAYHDTSGAFAVLEPADHHNNDIKHKVVPVTEVEPEASSMPMSLPKIGNNILTVCSSLSTAVREYYKLNQSDQVEVWEDLTGYQGQKRVFDPIDGTEKKSKEKQYEPPEKVEEALQQLPQELHRMPSGHKHAALDMALDLAPDYVLSRSFLLKFLRAEKFDVFAAACRMCRHFEAKLELFGKDKLGREITLADLDEDDMDMFNTGYLQVLQEADHSHRPVIFYYKAVSACYKKRENVLRSFWYLANHLSHQEMVQKLGVGNIVYNVGGFPHNGMDYEKSRRIAFLFQSVPVRFNNFYVCLDDNPWLTVVETFAVMITRFLRVRLRMFRGTHKEVVDKLTAVGAPAHALPVNDNSELIVDGHLQWIQKQREAEEKHRQHKNTTNTVAPDLVVSDEEEEEKQEVEPDLIIEMDIKLHDKSFKKMKKTYQMDTLENLADMI